MLHSKMYTPSLKPNTRIDVADVLRGIAIAGIVIIHSLEHFNFYNFPPAKSEFWESLNTGVWDTTFFLLASKMYAIFAMLFGLSFYIQHDNQAQKGKDFRRRFAWRMVLLLLIGFVDVTIYNGDILVIYALCGFLLIPTIRLSQKWLWALFVLFFIQPIEIVYIIGAIFNPELQPLDLNSGSYYGSIMPAQESGTFWECCKVSFMSGNPANITWAIENGRMTQTIALMLFGIILGRKRLFYNEDNNLSVWKRILLWSAVAFALLLVVYYTVPKTIGNSCISVRMHVVLNMWKNFAMMLFYVSATVLLFYRTRARKGLMLIAPYGKMSLTNYIGGSIIGTFLFYNWGLGLYRYSGHTISLLIGFGIVAVGWLFSRWWLANHQRGPLEDLWRRGTWIGLGR